MTRWKGREREIGEEELRKRKGLKKKVKTDSNTKNGPLQK